ncbi:MAG: ABC transporter substrate-binding protein [Acidobacteriota bacterium]
MRRTNNVIAIVFVLLVAGCNTERPKNPIVIGMQADRTGGISSWGYWLEKSAKVAAAEINSSGGINGRPIRLVIEDTETSPPVGARKFRKLVEADGAVAVIGSVHSGVMMATVPLADELKTPYFPIAMASEATEEHGNRYTFRINSHVHEQVNASVDWMLKKVAKKWAIVVSDYAWGWSHEKYFSQGIVNGGGEVVAKVRIPQGTKDFYPYLTKIPPDAEAVYFIFFGADSVGFIQQLHEKRPQLKKFTMICSLEAIDLPSLGGAVEGMYVLEYLPRALSENDTPTNRDFRTKLGVLPDGREVGNTGRTVAGSHYWASYEDLWLLKQAMEKSGFQGRQDTPKLVRALEEMGRIQHGQHFPQGDAVFRAEDHQGFHDHFMSQIQGGALKVLFRVPVQQILYPPVGNVSQRPLH